ncbi:hypothetical protein HDU96_010661 [Phlyctochytrium bullatum]|nr:hypothetical protein HDU96_010661 [Phlyctochytrium bullatum]
MFVELLLRGDAGKHGQADDLREFADYFTEEALRQKDPALFDYYIGQHIPDSEKKEAFPETMSLVDRMYKDIDDEAYFHQLEEQHRRGMDIDDEDSALSEDEANRGADADVEDEMDEGGDIDGEEAIGAPAPLGGFPVSGRRMMPKHHAARIRSRSRNAESRTATEVAQHQEEEEDTEEFDSDDDEGRAQAKARKVARKQRQAAIEAVMMASAGPSRRSRGQPVQIAVKQPASAIPTPGRTGSTSGPSHSASASSSRGRSQAGKRSSASTFAHTSSSSSIPTFPHLPTDSGVAPSSFTSVSTAAAPVFEPRASQPQRDNRMDTLSGPSPDARSTSQAQPKQPSRPQLSVEERGQLRDEFMRIMKERFLDGMDPEFPYARIDTNDVYDDLGQMERDEEDAYFDSEEPSGVDDDELGNGEDGTDGDEGSRKRKQSTSERWRRVCVGRVSENGEAAVDEAEYDY